MRSGLDGILDGAEAVRLFRDLHWVMLNLVTLSSVKHMTFYVHCSIKDHTRLSNYHKKISINAENVQNKRTVHLNLNLIVQLFLYTTYFINKLQNFPPIRHQSIKLISMQEELFQEIKLAYRATLISAHAYM